MAAIWATPEDVQRYTGAIVSESDIAMAQAIVDVFASIQSESIELDTLWPKDITRLCKATAYQAKFMQSQIDVLGRQDVKGVAQDGISSTYNTVDSVVLAPMSRIVISMLRWKRPRTLRSGRGSRQGVLELQRTWPRDGEQPGGGWSPVNFGGG
jgi:hypothetical protein